MKTLFIIGFFVMAIFSLVQAQDIGILLTDQRLVQREISCILESGPCDALGRVIKGLLPEALNNKCQRCNPRQARNARKLIDFMQTSYPREWNMIVQRYSTNNNYLGH